MSAAVALTFLLDEDLPPAIAAAGRGLGLDVASVHELGRLGYADRNQLAMAHADARVFVTRNRDDFIRLTVEMFQTAGPHAGVLIVPRSLPNRRPAAIAHALLRWHAERGADFDPRYTIDFLAA
jgi:predicted nuclease of predicted toxin-antitoxin system